jgi:hypothetical protein
MTESNSTGSRGGKLTGLYANLLNSNNPAIISREPVLSSAQPEQSKAEEDAAAKQPINAGRAQL